MINLINIIDLELISENELHKAYPILLPVLKTCLTDDWGPDLRIASCKLVEKLLLYVSGVIDSDQLREIYPSLLERLDDA